MPLYATYDTNTASRIVRWRRDGRYNLAAIFDPPVAFTGARGVFTWKHGGKRHNPRDLNAGASTVMQMMTDELGAYVVLYDAPPGGFWNADAEEVDLEVFPECRKSDALFHMWLRAHADDTAVVGTTRTIDRARKRWCAGGDSSGTWDQIGAQLVPFGDFAWLADRESARGGREFRYDADHRVGHVFGFEGQNRLSSFNEYVTSTAGATTYVAGAETAGSSNLDLSGDTVTLRRANRLLVVTTSSYTFSGTNLAGATSINVTGSSMAIPQGCYLRFNDGTEDQEHLVVADFAGGTGAISIVGNPLERDVTAGTAISIRFDVAVVNDTAGGTHTCEVWPTVPVNVVAGSPVELLHFNWEDYLEPGWASAYVMSGNSGYTWRTFPFARKRAADLDLLVRSDNPRVKECNWYLACPNGQSLWRVDSLTHARSFAVRHAGAPAILPERMSLHDEGDNALLAKLLYDAGAGANIHAYLGDRFSNPLGTDASVPWLKGRNASHDAQVLKAFVTDSARAGGAFS